MKFQSENLGAKRQLWIPTHREKDNRDLKEIGFQDVDWIHLAQGRVQ
jgi:hypothetical protein